MAIASRLRCRRRLTNPEMVDVQDVNGTDVFSDYEATHQETEITERSGQFGEMSTRIVDLFYFDEVDGTLPAINERYTIVWAGTSYEVLSVQSLNELMKRLRVVTERVR